MNLEIPSKETIGDCFSLFGSFPFLAENQQDPARLETQTGSHDVEHLGCTYQLKAEPSSLDGVYEQDCLHFDRATTA